MIRYLCNRPIGPVNIESRSHGERSFIFSCYQFHQGLLGYRGRSSPLPGHASFRGPPVLDQARGLGDRARPQGGKKTRQEGRFASQWREEANGTQTRPRLESSKQIRFIRERPQKGGDDLTRQMQYNAGPGYR
jgi:hypothetical protein